jgi:hypothetical protein
MAAREAAVETYKGGRGWDCSCGGKRRHHSRAERRLITAAEGVTLARVYFTCRRCGAHARALDDRLGLDGFVSPHAQQLLCTLGTDWSFDRCARHLRTVAGLVVCDNTVRKACDRHDGLMRAWQREAPEASEPFRGDRRRGVPDRRDLRQHHRRLARGAAVDLRQT